MCVLSPRKGRPRTKPRPCRRQKPGGEGKSRYFVVRRHRRLPTSAASQPPPHPNHRALFFLPARGVSLTGGRLQDVSYCQPYDDDEGRMWPGGDNGHTKAQVG